MDKKLTSKELIVKHCDIIRNKSNKGSVLVFGGREFRMNRKFDDLPEEDFDKILADQELGMGRYIEKVEKAGTTKVERKRAKKAAVDATALPCECGCGDMARAGSKFLPGHDAKLKSKLRKQYLEGNAKGKTEAEKQFNARGWGKYIPVPTKAKKVAKVAKVAPKKAAPRPKAQPTMVEALAKQAVRDVFKAKPEAAPQEIRD